MRADLITARELGEMLVAYGDRAIKLRVQIDGSEDYMCMMLHRDVDICQRAGQQTAYGNIDLVRLTVIDRDDA